MALDYRDEFDLVPIPVGSRRAALQAVLIRARIQDAGGYDAGVSAAVQAVLAPAPPGTASELARLRGLYAAAYTPAELRSLVVNTFAGLGILPDEPDD